MGNEMGSDAGTSAHPNEMGTTMSKTEYELEAFTLIRARPPNFDAIAARFPMASHHGVCFAYGPVVYSPDLARLPPEIVQHELTHCRRQLAHPGGVEAWWQRYLTDHAFTLAEEAPAHHAEWLAVLRGVPLPSASRQRRMRAAIAERLSGPLYDHAITMHDALALLDGDGTNFLAGLSFPGFAP